MSDLWTIRGVEFANCNCAWGCPCQFNSPTTHGHCEAVVSGHIEEGHHGDTSLDGLDWVMLVWWPGEVAEGNGKQQIIISDKANAEQREALGRILHGDDTEPGATHFFVYNSTMAEVLETRFEPIDVDIDVEARTARVSIPGLVESRGAPIIDEHTGAEKRARIDLPNGFEYTVAEMGTGTSRTTAGIELELSDSYGQFCVLHMNQDGVIR